jgi:dolichol kinase
MQPANGLERRQAMAPEPQRLSLSRKLAHMALAVVPAAGWLVSYWLALALAGALLLASLALEAARRWWPWVNRLLWRFLPTIFRSWEGTRVLGSTWFAVGVAATLLLFGPDVGGTAVLFLSWGDPMAEVVGRRWGGGRGGKTLVGSLGCLLACLVAGIVGIGLGGLSPWSVLAGAVVATMVERWSPLPDDNLWMPTLSGLAMGLVGWLVGGQPVLFPMWR